MRDERYKRPLTVEADMIGRCRPLPVVLVVVLTVALALSPSVSATGAVSASTVGTAGAGVGPTAGGPAVSASSAQDAYRAQQAGAVNATPVTGCEEITEPGRYVLTRNVTNDLGTRTSQNCVWINSSDVVFDGGGHRIDGIGVTDSIGVYVGSPARVENVTVRNLTVSDWHKGIWHRGIRSGTVREVNATDNAIGIGVENASGTRVIDNEASENLIGIRVTDSVLGALSGNDLSDNYGVGIYDELVALDLFDNRVTVGPPLDPDGDGRYEDVTGDRETDVYDALSLLGVVTADLASVGDLDDDHREMLDLDGDGDLGYGDVWTLLGN